MPPPKPWAAESPLTVLLSSVSVPLLLEIEPAAQTALNPRKVTQRSPSPAMFCTHSSTTLDETRLARRAHGYPPFYPDPVRVILKVCVSNEDGKTGHHLRALRTRLKKPDIVDMSPMTSMNRSGGLGAIS